MSRLLVRVLIVALWGAGAVTLTRVGVLYAAMYAMDQGYRPVAWSSPNLLLALWYTGPVMAIILAHELGHRVACKRYGVRASGPFLIPWPSSWAGALPWAWLPTIGVLAAFLRFQPAPLSKVAQWDIALTGLAAGFLATSVCTVLGAAWSIRLYDPHIFGHVWMPSIVQWATGERVTWHPVMFAARVGWCLTAVSLLPCWPMDGYRLWWSLPAIWHLRRVQVWMFFSMVILCLA